MGRLRVKVEQGKKYNHLAAVSFSHISNKGHQMWLCECDCEEHTKCIVRAAELLSGHKVSCGCVYRLGNNTKHGMHKSRLYNIYHKMISRCYTVENKDYKRYGGKGITVCEEWWESFENFQIWAMNNGYSEKLTIDRIDNLKGYTPDNCRWATHKTQQNNRTNNHRLTYDGKTHTLSEWEDITGINQDALYARLKLGWGVEKTLTTPIQRRAI